MIDKNKKPTAISVEDYINGHLDLEEQAKFEAQMKTDTQLADEIKFQQMLKTTVSKVDIQQHVEPQFSQIANKLDKKRSFSDFLFDSWAKPAAYAFSTILLSVTLIVTQHSKDGVNLEAQYVTLSDASDAISHPILRIVASDTAAFEQLIQDYKNEISQQYPSALTLDIKEKDLAKSLNIMNKLVNDERVRLVQLVEPK